MSIELSPPIVMERKAEKKKKKKKKYSTELKTIQMVEKDFTKISLQTLEAFTAGLTGYEKARNKSAKKKRDGAVVDFVPNVGKGISKTMRKASPIPFKIAKTSSNTAWQITRYQINMVSQIADDMLNR